MKRNILKTLFLINILFLTINNVSANNIYDSHFKNFSDTVIELFISESPDEDIFDNSYPILTFYNYKINFNFNYKNILKNILLSHQQIYNTSMKINTLLFITIFNQSLFSPSKYKNLSYSDSDYLHLV